MEIKEENRGQYCLLYLSGRLDRFSAPDLEEKFSQLCDNGKCNVIIDFSDVSYISSSGLGVLFNSVKKVKIKGGSIIMSSLTAPVEGVFNISGLYSIFEVCKDVNEAGEKMKSKIK